MYYPMKHFEGRVWPAKLSLLPLFCAVSQFQREKHRLGRWGWVITSLLLLTYLWVWGKSFYLMPEVLCLQDSEERSSCFIMQCNIKFVCAKWNFYLASSGHSTFFFPHYIMKKPKETLCCTKEHLSLLKYLEMIVFLSRKYIKLK